MVYSRGPFFLKGTKADVDAWYASMGLPNDAPRWKVKQIRNMNDAPIDALYVRCSRSASFSGLCSDFTPSPHARSLTLGLSRINERGAAGARARARRRRSAVAALASHATPRGVAEPTAALCDDHRLKQA